MERLLTRPLARRACLLLAALAAAVTVTVGPAEAAPPDHAQAHNAARALEAPGNGVQAEGWTWIR